MSAEPFETSSRIIAERFAGTNFDLAVVLGSGLGGFAKHVKVDSVISTSDIPGYPMSTVVGHGGELISAKVEGKRVLVFSGRVHYYENKSTAAAATAAIVSSGLGIKRIVLTNAAGILNQSFQPGDLMVINDQINLTFRDVLKGNNRGILDLSPIYSPDLARTAHAAGEASGVNLKSGIYIGLTGPSYETAAEVRMYRLLGGDAIGMSTIHEAIYARSAGMQVLGISCLTNYSTGLSKEKLSHSEVTEIGARVDTKFSKLLLKLVALL